MMFKRIIFPLFALGFLFWGMGCSENSTDPEVLTGEVDLESEFGGYLATPESPGFDNPDLIEEASNDVEFDDPMLGTSDVDSIISDPDAGYYHLRIAWGQLSYDSTVNVVTDWSGSLSITRGAEIIRRVIHFEPGQDYIIERTDRKLIEWASVTTVHNDGIAIDIVIPPSLPEFDTTVVTEITPEGDTVETIVVDTVYPVLDPVEVAFETGPYSRTFTLEEIAALDTIVYLDDSNAVAFHGLKLDRMPCPRGFLGGYWGYDEEGRSIFCGVWMSQFGYISGYLRGHYGVNENGFKVFFGKWISRTGEFSGFLRGVYGYFPEPVNFENPNKVVPGWFEGMIYSREKERIGYLKGKFKSSTTDE
ncbi:MAG: hypothetical protein ACE5D6_08465, partial [Candidatus Zixiibacteriota bacterium]